MPMRLNKKNFEVATKWIPTAMVYGTTATLGLLYFTEWKAVLQYVPFYGSKYDE